MGDKKAQEILDGMQSFDCKTRLKYMKELKVLCHIIGMERTKMELVEFLYNIIEDDSDVLIELSNNLVFLTNFINNVNNCYFLCDLILNFIITYEKEININGYNAFKNYIHKCDSSTLINIIYPRIIRLANNESDNYRIGVSKIIPILIERCIYEDQANYMKSFIHLFLELCQDQSILVKKSCCDKFCNFLKILKRYREHIHNSAYTTIKHEQYVKEIDVKEVHNNSDIDSVNKNIKKSNHRLWKQIKENKNEGEAEELKKREEENVIMNADGDKAWVLAPNSISPSSITPSGIMPNGITPSSITPSGITPNGTSPNEGTPNSALPWGGKGEWSSLSDRTSEKKTKIFVDKIWEKAQEIYRSFFYPINGLDEVQISAVSILNEVLYNDPNFVNNLDQVLTSICNDESWRVRAVLANNIQEILKNQKNDDLSVILLLLLKDLDSNVRSIVLNNLDRILVHSKIKVNILDEIFEDLKKDIDSNNIHLKISLCKLLCTLPDVLDKDGSIEYILPLFLLFIRIEESNLKSELFICLHKISKLISFFDMKQIIIPLSKEIVKSKNWRLRCSLYYHLKFFDHFFLYQNKENSSSNYVDFWNYMHTGAKDLVYSIRIEVAETLYFLIKNRNFSFFEKGLTYLLNDLKESTNYINRISCLQFISKLVILFPLQYIENYILKVIKDLSKDKISNIRYNIVKTIYYINKYVKHVLTIITNNTYDELINNVTKMIDQKNKENKQNCSTPRHKNNNTHYFHFLENRQNLLNYKMHNKGDSFLINSCHLSSLSFYHNMKNIITNKNSCEHILNFLSDILNSLEKDIDNDVSKASYSLKNNDFFFYISSVNTFNTVCKPIK
ncbi:protein phosphatase PP2A regulatory subunit A [Plasmodium brasilianum]|uniref:Protein phosphatase PP2A regulatory subunit A, putative n=2 Tax=Plasmodium (Plasmodium) TaxID=418103 RepID=A0A1A8WEB6_PLAMA|nr:protein phosphatase PP2A regulatory subunit A, putative [Plasmodium malariae]KAI4834752.1 protein phosphatase PP2A regulatory subunit A [Plasmodium brasilianum]SBS90389.1 protein phosphatase PP2A regulatory subunit A, putative [Plasmodium malariae]SCP03310.1 protein phosphatase PP2A regulatory subunit A, putative [Plasmodium malariae]